MTEFPGDYVQFTEFNDHEGETWTFWLQVDGNEFALMALADIMERVQGTANGENAPFRLDLNTCLQAAEVDVLVEYGGSGYMNYHNRVDGVMQFPEWTKLVDDVGFGPELEGLYKGGIEQLFK